MSNTKGQLSQANNSNQGVKQFRFDYTELDELLIDLPDHIEVFAESFREFHCTFTRAMTVVANANQSDDRPFHWVPADAADYISYYDKLFRILENMKENPESSRGEDPDQSGSGPARCPNCDNKDKINSLLEKLLKEKEEEIDELKQINESLKEKIDSLEKKRRTRS